MWLSEKSKRAVIRANKWKIVKREKGRACQRLFKYLNPSTTLPTSRKTISHVKMSNVVHQKCDVGGFRSLTCMLDSGRMKPNDWQKCWSKLSQLTNHREETSTCTCILERGTENDAYSRVLIKCQQPAKNGYLEVWAIHFLGKYGKVRDWKPDIAYSTQLPSHQL